QASALNPLEKDIQRLGKIMQLDGGAEGSRPEPQRIPLSPSPGSPFNDHRQTTREQLLTELPLQRLDPPALFLVPQVSETASIHSSGQKRTAPSLLSRALANVVLPEPGNPHTTINLAPVLDLSIRSPQGDYLALLTSLSSALDPTRLSFRAP